MHNSTFRLPVQTAHTPKTKVHRDSCCRIICIYTCTIFPSLFIVIPADLQFKLADAGNPFTIRWKTILRVLKKNKRKFKRITKDTAETQKTIYNYYIIIPARPLHTGRALARVCRNTRLSFRFRVSIYNAFSKTVSIYYYYYLTINAERANLSMTI